MNEILKWCRRYRMLLVVVVSVVDVALLIPAAFEGMGQSQEDAVILEPDSVVGTEPEAVGQEKEGEEEMEKFEYFLIQLSNLPLQ